LVTGDEVLVMRSVVLGRVEVVGWLSVFHPVQYLRKTINSLKTYR
jgi:hypothetical protein